MLENKEAGVAFANRLEFCDREGRTSDLDTLPNDADWGDPSLLKRLEQSWGVRCSWCHEYRIAPEVAAAG